MKRIVLSLPLAIALAGCGDKADESPANDNRGAEGEVLGGTISDAMLPLDTVTSQSPPLRETSSPGASGDGPPAAEDADSVDGGEGESETPEPAPEPDPEPEDGA